MSLQSHFYYIHSWLVVSVKLKRDTMTLLPLHLIDQYESPHSSACPLSG